MLRVNQEADGFPERDMIEVAVKLAIVEKFTTMLGTLNFIWATTVLLGGFASSLNLRDFWFVSIILMAEGIRFFGRKGELHTRSNFFGTIIKIYSLPIQELSAMIFCSLSMKGFLALSQSKVENQNLALKIFYVVSIVEYILGLFGLVLRIFVGISGYHIHHYLRVRSEEVLDVKNRCGLDESQIHTLYQFFHYTYSQSVRGSIFDSSNMTIVSYSVELLQSSNGDEQLRGATLLSALVKGYKFSLERLRSIEAIRGVVEMLIDMLNWEWNINPEMGMERIEIPRAAADIISNLVEIPRYRTLVMAAPGSMESIASLLKKGNLDFSELGLKILKGLADDHDNRAKMGSNRGLLLKIITFTESNAPELKILAIETLASIARDQELRESIGDTDGVLHNLFRLFFKDIDDNDHQEKKLRISAGKALGFLSLNNNQNGEIMKSIRRAYFQIWIPGLISVLDDGHRGTYAARILRNLSADLEVELNARGVPMQREFRANGIEKLIIDASDEVVGVVMEREGIHQEAAIGLAAQIFKFLSESDYHLVFGQPWDEKKKSLILKLRDVLRQHASPSEELPNIRRFSLLLLIAVIRGVDRSTIPQGSEDETDLNNALEGVMNTTSALESCSTLSGGLRSDSMAIPFLAQYAKQLLQN